MKQPEIVTIADCLSRIERFDTVLDVRSPSEYALDHLPGAVNAPVLDDEQRIHVGTVYKQIGAFEAKRIGAALVAKNIAAHLEHSFADHGRDWRVLIYCWRGGNRSAAMATVLARVGWQVSVIDGGYREFRRMVNQQLLEWPGKFRWQVLAGRTGSGKSALLRALRRRGAQVLDLEALANHRGSVLGAVPAQPQPPQKWFETQIWDALRRFDPARPVFVESESKKVGQNHVPDALITAMRASPCISVNATIAVRVAQLLSEYQFFVEQPNLLKSKLAMLHDLHGQARLDHWNALIDSDRWPELVEQLLVHHYDPSYDRSIKRNFGQFDQARTIEIARASDDAIDQAGAELLAALDSTR